MAVVGGAEENFAVERLIAGCEKVKERSWYQWLELDEPGQKPDVIMCLIGCAVYFVGVMFKPLKAMVVMLFHYEKALSLSCLVGQIVALALHTFVLAMWFSLAFGTVRTERVLYTERAKNRKKSFFHNLMSKGLYGHNFMPGGFSPRWFALSLGILMFVNQNLLVTVIIKGSVFNTPGPGDPAVIAKWPADIGCIANSKMPSAAASMWFSRLWTKDPEGCYLVKPGELGRDLAKIGERYGVTREHFYVRPNATLHPNIVFPFVKGSKTEVDKSQTCMYTCVTWKSASMQTTMLKSGVIVAGGVFIERFTNYVTSNWGFATITANSKAPELSLVLDILLADPTAFLGNLRRFCFLMAMICIQLFVYAIAPMVSRNGYFTTDYYVTSAIFLSILLASLLRNFDILEGRRAVYTDNIWAKGADLFHARTVHKMFNIDLYEWAHIPSLSKAQLLMDYARRVDVLKTPAFDLEKFFLERGNRQMGSASERQSVAKGQSGAVPAAAGANNVSQSLLDIDTRISALEGGLHKQKENNLNKVSSKDRIGECNRADQVRCIKEYESFADVFMQDESGDWVPEKVQLRIKARARGILKGRTAYNTLLVEWEKNELIEWPHDQMSDRNEATFMAATTFLSDIKDTYVLEITDEWHALQDRVDARAEELAKQGRNGES